jgi:hypothetical protein
MAGDMHWLRNNQCGVPPGLYLVYVFYLLHLNSSFET